MDVRLAAEGDIYFKENVVKLLSSTLIDVGRQGQILYIFGATPNPYVKKGCNTDRKGQELYCIVI